MKKPLESCGLRWKNDIEVGLHKRDVRIVAGFQWLSTGSNGLLCACGNDEPLDNFLTR